MPTSGTASAPPVGPCLSPLLPLAPPYQAPWLHRPAACKQPKARAQQGNQPQPPWQGCHVVVKRLGAEARPRSGPPAWHESPTSASPRFHPGTAVRGGSCFSCLARVGPCIKQVPSSCSPCPCAACPEVGTQPFILTGKINTGTCSAL